MSVIIKQEAVRDGVVVHWRVVKCETAEIADTLIAYTRVEGAEVVNTILPAWPEEPT